MRAGLKGHIGLAVDSSETSMVGKTHEDTFECKPRQLLLHIL